MIPTFPSILLLASDFFMPASTLSKAFARVTAYSFAFEASAPGEKAVV
jgi:hypothetical protein